MQQPGLCYKFSLSFLPPDLQKEAPPISGAANVTKFDYFPILRSILNAFYFEGARGVF